MKKFIVKNKTIFELLGILSMILVICGFITSRIGINKVVICLTLLSILIVVFKFKYETFFDNTLEKIFKFRWLLYLVVFLICVIFKLNGSSIGVYNTYYKEKIDSTKNTILLGQPRYIRSDEFNVLTPYYISQTYNKFKKNSNMMSLTPQNMIIGYNAPVKDITILAKPLDWGYILFGKDYGLSWYWCMKIILIFAFALECMYIFTKNKKLSIVGAFLVALGPSTQWWFAPHMPDVILWIMAVLSTMYYYLTIDKRWLKNLLMIIIPFIITEFVIALFPSFQVGLGIFAFIMFVLLIIRDKIPLFKDKKQNIRHIVLFLLTISLVGYFIITNKEALLATMNTAYPGNRISTGGIDNFSSIFTDLTTIFLPYKEITYSNNCEVSTYIHFGFFIALLFPILYKIMKKNKDRNIIIGTGMLLILIVYAIFMIIGFPTWLAKITLFSRINRMKMIFGIISIFFTIWGFDAIIKYRKQINPIYYCLCCVIFCLINVSFITPEIKQYLPWFLFIFEIIVFFAILVFMYFKWDKISISLLLGLLFFGTILINPISRGTTDIYNHPSAKKIQDIVKKDKNAYWLGYNSIVSQNYIMLNGGKSINAVNFYPDKKKWKILDPKGKYDEIYNRYAHLQVIFTKNENDKIKLENLTPDLIKMELNLQDLINLNVKYILSSEELDRENDNYKLKKIYKDMDCYIYELVNKQ